MFPAGSLNQAIYGPPPRFVPVRDCFAGVLGTQTGTGATFVA
jgi:hypothetical protein